MTPAARNITQDEEREGPRGQEAAATGSGTPSEEEEKVEDDDGGPRHEATPRRVVYHPIYGEEVFPNGALPSGKGLYTQKLAQI